jgi:hypothetical protein
MPDYYDILGVSPTAPQKEIKAAFRQQAKQYHPDKVGESRKKAAEDKFKRIAEAYYILEDPARRCEYDILRTQVKRDAVRESASAHTGTVTLDMDHIIRYAKEELREIDRGTFIVRFVFGAALGLVLGLFWSVGWSIHSKLMFCLFLLIPMLLLGLLSAILGDRFWQSRFIQWIWWWF